MEKTCPKCKYTRKATDYAPDYECPSCGVIYSKFVPRDATGKKVATKAAEEKNLVAGALSWVIGKAGDTTIKPQLSNGWLWCGVVFMPYIFAWFTLRKEYSTRTRIMAFGWMAVFIIGFLSPNTPRSDQNAQTQERSPEREPEEKLPTGISRKTFDAIHIGMSKSKVKWTPASRQ